MKRDWKIGRTSEKISYTFSCSAVSSAKIFPVRFSFLRPESIRGSWSHRLHTSIAGQQVHYGGHKALADFQFTFVLLFSFIAFGLFITLESVFCVSQILLVVDSITLSMKELKYLPRFEHLSQDNVTTMAFGTTVS